MSIYPFGQEYLLKRYKKLSYDEGQFAQTTCCSVEAVGVSLVMEGIDGVLVGLVTLMVGSSIFSGKDVLGYMPLDVTTDHSVTG